MACPMAAGIQYINYGTFDRTDESGNIIGSLLQMILFSPEQFEANRKITYGASAKFIYSVLESYVSTGVAADLATNYRSNDSLILSPQLLVI